MSTMLMGWRYSKYKRHWPYGQLSEYFHGGRRVISRILKGRLYERMIAELVNSGRDYYVFPMQVDVDSQIIYHSHFNGQADALRLIMQSFSEHAPKQSLLVITEHPLETSPVNWKKIVTEHAAALGIAAQIKFLPGGSPKELLAASRGVVVINSTTGHQGLELGIPVIALSAAVFNLSGITFQAGLDRFWKEADPADAGLVRAYRKVVIRQTQINGSFFGKRGIAAAIANAVPAIETASCRDEMLDGEEAVFAHGCLTAKDRMPAKNGSSNRIRAATRQEKFT